MKIIYTLILLLLLLTSCHDDFNSEKGSISKSLSKGDNIAITKGEDIFYIKRDSTITDTLKNKIYFVYPWDQDLSDIESKSFKYRFFNVYHYVIIHDEWGEAYRRYFLSDDKNSIQILTYRKSDTLQIGERVLVIWSGDMVKPIKEIK
jgi:hypothetical protein